MQSILGSISWRPPSWLKRTADSWSRLEHAHPRLIAPAIIVVFLLSCGGVWSWHWYQSRPKPYRVHVNIRPIPVTKLEKELKFPALVVHFSDHAARLEDLKKPLLDGIRLTPQIAGAWRWSADDTLLFEPKEDWPAGTKFTIDFEKKLFPQRVRLERLRFEFQSPSFGIAIRELKLYQDPINPAVRQVTATFEMTHRIEPGELERRVEFEMLGGSRIFAPTDPAPHFTVTYGLHNRLAYLRSSFVTLPEREDWFKLRLNKGVRAAQSEAATCETLEEKLQIPSVATFFRIESARGEIVRNKHAEPEQIVILNTSAEIASRELAKSMELWLLPKRKVENAGSAENEAGDDSSDEEQLTNEGAKSKWQSATDVSDEVLAAGKRIEFTTAPSDKERDTQHAFRVRIESDGELYLRVNKGVRAFGDYPLVNNFNAVIPVPEYPREIEIEGSGGLLALSGERKLSIRSRGLPAIEYEVARVATNQINHLVSQTEGKFQHPQFQDPGIFDQENISRIALEHQSIALENKWKANYSSFDFSEHLRKPSDGGSERGLFFLTARGWDPINHKAIPSVRETRFLLLTDIGILTKKSSSGVCDVFLMSIQSGRPIANATVEIIGKNGVALQRETTAADGHVAFRSVDKMERDKTPVAFVARNGDDVAFIPYARADRLLNFSRFDIDGAQNLSAEDLDAFIFTERGVYRPGDEIHIGLVVKQRNWSGQLAGLPIETEVLDARDLPVQTKKIALPENGFVELSYQTGNESPTGAYQINAYLIRNNKRSTLLGSTIANVKEFLPDRMKIEARLSQEITHGWIKPRQVRAAISLTNLYGTPAADRRVTAKLDLSPAEFCFPELRGFIFFDSLRDDKKQRTAQSIELGEKKTDNDGRTEFDLQLERFADATYSMRFIAEGFEADGGRSVANQKSVLVSDLPFVIGAKPDGDLHYIEANKQRGLDFIAVDSQLKRVAVENITLNLIAQEYISVLARQENGNFAYRSVLKERLARSENLTISAAGLHYVLPTSEPGNYILELRDDQNRRLSQLRYCVVGSGASSPSLQKNAELDVKLDRSHYQSGDDITVSVTAPYAGSGLITIERDRVYGYTWFQTTTASSIQHIHLPEGFEGSGYVNVTFVRALNAKEISISPLSYGVVHFTANVEKRRLALDLQAPAAAKPGEPLQVAYKTDRPCKIVLFAVDEGILQVTDFKTPDPIGFFFRKCALGVETSQIVDLIIPEFSLLRSLSAFGGGGDIQRLNPFKRITEKPVVFWSGLLDANVDWHEVVYDVPDFFDGTLKIMAVAVADDAAASAEREALIRGPFVITPSVPVLVAPGDEFEAGVTVANNLDSETEIDLRVEVSAHFSLVGAATRQLSIAAGREQTAVFRFHVAGKLGSGEIRFNARGNNEESVRRTTISIRPPVPYLTDVRSGNFNGAGIDVPITRTLHSEFRQLEASVAALPLGLAHGLDAYLKNFPYGCSEQITSAALCRLLLADEVDFGLKRPEVNAQLEKTFIILRRRQNDQGAFGYWAPEERAEISFVSVYVMDFLIQAKAAGFPPSSEMFATGLRNLQTMAGREPSTFSDARTLAYAIYLLTREGVVTTNYILNLRDYLDKHQARDWQRDVSGVYLAGALKLLHQDDEAERLIAQYRLGDPHNSYWSDFCQLLGADSQYIAILAGHFPARLRKISVEEFEKISRPIAEGQFNTLSAAYAVAALKAYSQVVARNVPELSIAELDDNKTETRLKSGPKLLQRTDFSARTKAVRFRAATPVGGPGAFFQVIEAGFDRAVPDRPLADGLEVYREFLVKNTPGITRTHLGESVHVRLHVRSLKDRATTNVAIIDLLPGGFEIVDSSLRPGVSSIPGIDYVDVREDRAVFFGTAPRAALQIDYDIKSCNRGEFVVPPVFAQSMYDRGVKGRGAGGKIIVAE
ncbi:MAG TPA: alpha-2-macroglobulin [Chthoniobacterales bacterium]|nr:alpha-2-macroglobulin [Chthoniobacterales bacterium]